MPARARAPHDSKGRVSLCPHSEERSPHCHSEERTTKNLRCLLTRSLVVVMDMASEPDLRFLTPFGMTGGVPHYSKGRGSAWQRGEGFCMMVCGTVPDRPSYGKSTTLVMRFIRPLDKMLRGAATGQGATGCGHWTRCYGVRPLDKVLRGAAIGQDATGCGHWTRCYGVRPLDKVLRGAATGQDATGCGHWTRCGGSCGHWTRCCGGHPRQPAASGGALLWFTFADWDVDDLAGEPSRGRDSEEADRTTDASAPSPTYGR